ncbi:cell wall-active antibiotics response protein LiaF [Sediminibacillus massiliensis]|uniref:cell wall-active antibiotics response protein LiaF n=1 Tax=Sediminibacillus massiliensis TaxID=1926277 RepID=UPI0009886EC5|nr:cell wall-active antibiotics response protein LiaF [Sediminibacillus massiliensis]
MKQNRFFRSVIAITIILLGAALFLANIGLLSWQLNEAWAFIYPAFFVLLGLKWCLGGIKGEGGLAVGSFLVIFGALLLMDRFDLLSFWFWDFYKLWPLLIVYLGFSIFGTSTKRKKNYSFIFDSDKGDKTKTAGKKQRFPIGDHNFQASNWEVEPMDLWNAVGDYHLDFTKAFIPDKEIPINIRGWAGDIRILMPENVECKIDAHVKAGDIHVFGQNAEGVNKEVFHQTPNYKDATRKLNIQLSLKAGNIRVDRV